MFVVIPLDRDLLLFWSLRSYYVRRMEVNTVQKKIFRIKEIGLIIFIITINLIIFTNSFFHNPSIGYDAESHLKNIQIYPFDIPTPEESREFFSPPLPYFLPSLVNIICLAQGGENCISMAGRSALYINFLLSIFISLFFWKISEKIDPGNINLKWLVFVNLGTLTVYYKTFSQVRGEPYIAFFVVLLIYYILTILENLKSDRVFYKNAIVLGLILGCSILSRQWAFFIIPALLIVFILIWMKKAKIRKKLSVFFLITMSITIFIGCWFYLFLQSKYGTITAFNLDSPGFSFLNQPQLFYRATGLKHFLLFKEPVRPIFNFTFFPILYSDTWGDYWGYFSYFPSTTDALYMKTYLGRVNITSIIPTILIVVSFWGIVFDIFKNKKHFFETNLPIIELLLILVIIFTTIGFLWFVISYPEKTDGDTVKSTYIIQAIILFPLLVGIYLKEKIRNNSKLWVVLIVTVGAIFITNFLAFFSFSVPLTFIKKVFLY